MRKRRSNKKGIIIGVSIFVILLIAASAFFYIQQNKEESDKETAALQNSQSATNESSIDVKKDVSEDEDSQNDPTENDHTDIVTYNENEVDPQEPTYIDGIMIVNKKYALPSTYNKGEDPEAKAALEKMFAAGKDAGYTYEAFSGFRSYEYQTQLYNRYVARDGIEAADRYSARPGHSEHQTGLAFDVGESSRQDLWLTEEFGETPAGQWLMENAHIYGFVLRYPKGTENITGYMYESWHYRYVGVETATAVKEAGVTLEEYLNIN